MRGQAGTEIPEGSPKFLAYVLSVPETRVPFFGLRFLGTSLDFARDPELVEGQEMEQIAKPERLKKILNSRREWILGQASSRIFS